MNVKEKLLLLLGVFLSIAGRILGHHYWACAVAVLQHIVA